MDTMLTRWSPLSELADLRERIDRAFAEGGGGAWAPRIDVVEEEDRIVLRADLPGVKADETKIEVSDDVLTVSGSHSEEQEEESDGKRYVRRERRTGSFSRSLRLPPGVDPKQIEALQADGVLEVIVPLPPEGAKAARVEIKAKAE